MIKEHALLPLFQKFVTDTRKGRRLNKNGNRIKPQTVINYSYCYKLLDDFAFDKTFNLIVYEIKGNNKREHNALKKYYGNFYKQFTSYMYNYKNCYDNYTGQNIKIIRTFFNWLNDVQGTHTGSFHKSFYIAKEDIAIVTLSVEQLQFFLFNEAFEAGLTLALRRSKDVFVIGCLTGLRFSDICRLQVQNIEHRDGCTYITTKSQKSNTGTMVKIPPQALNIIGKYVNNKAGLLPTVSLPQFNKNIKKLGQLAGWEYPIPLTGINKANGKQRNISKNVTRKFYEALSSHTKRRTCITTMLTSGMPDYVVRKISGHTSESKAFFRYVNLAQSLVDKEIDKMHIHFLKPATINQTANS